MPDKSDKIRDGLAIRASTTFFLRSMGMISKTVGGGDMLRGVIFMAIIDANVRALTSDSALSQAYSEAGDVVPDTLRHPVSVHALAQSMDLPYETTRRHVNRLIADGLCVRRDTGVIIPGAVLARDPMVASVRKNFEYLCDLFGELRAGGVEFDSGSRNERAPAP